MATTLDGVDDLLSLTGGHPLVRTHLRFRRRVLRVWSEHGAVAWLARDDRPDRDTVPLLSGWGEDPAEVAALVDLLTPELPTPARLSVPRAAAALTRTVHVDDPSQWDFLWTTREPPAVPGEEAVAVLPDSAAEEIVALLAVSNPTANARPGGHGVRGWAGLRDDRGLAAVVADTSGGDIGHLSAVGTRPDARRRGYGAAVTAFLARLHVREFGTASLGMYAANESARRVYLRLGFDGLVRMTSGAAVRV